MKSWVTAILAGAVLGLLGGCEQEIVGQFQAARELVKAGEKKPADRFWAEVTFCRKIGKKTGKRIGEGRTFACGQKSAVHGLVDFSNVPLDRIHSVHLVWIKPGGREMFRHYEEVLVTESEGGYTVHRSRKKAEDLGYLREKVETVSEPGFTLGTKLNTSLSRARVPGTYVFRVYWNREFLLEEAFELEGPDPESEVEEDQTVPAK